ncbi:Ryanodine receptor 3 [Phytophthora citrophthora]|uniref:Ryanodine receptor 3 n=1 Tax=Phytophthora citrophthora TaxID=4793 RepID=A0AAD9LQ66_9STRA|nr:Ryanodine receptor 3 [Phytophthora citrophthora]
MIVLSDERTRVLEAFYARVIQRVCASYRDESELPADEAVERLQQKWQEKLSLYTGNRLQSNTVVNNCGNEVLEVEATELRSSSDSDVESSDGFSVSSSSSSSSSSSDSEAASEQDMGRPSAQVLGGKRKLNQLDGFVSDDEEGQGDVIEELQLQDLDTSTLVFESLVQEGSGAEADNSGSEIEEELDIDSEEETKEAEIPSSQANGSASTLLLVSAEDLSPISGLSGMNLPLQLAAEYSKFSHRGKRRGYCGELNAIVLTWPSCLGVSETLHPDDLIWCCPDAERGFLEEGELVKVVSLGDTMDELRIQHSNGVESTVRRSTVRRLKEFLISKGTFTTDQASKLQWYLKIVTLVSGNSSHVTHQGLLQYQGKDGDWKERWFILDAIKPALVKCNTTNHLPAGSYGSVLGGDVLIADARPLSELQASLTNDGLPGGDTAVGFEVTTQSGAKIIFRSKSVKEQSSWLTAINKTASGFTPGVADRLADRELLAGKYSLVRELGRGASGIVSLYTAQGRPFAIKKFVPQKSKGVPNRRAVPVATGRRPSTQVAHSNEIPDDVRREVALLKKAMSVHQSRFLKIAAAIRHDTLNDLVKEAEDVDNPVLSDEEYKPNPIDTKETELPLWFQPHRELVAAQMHFDWCRGKSLAGWKYGDHRDDTQLVHPCMLPMRVLDSTTRSRNFSSVDEIVKCVVALGVHVSYHRPSKLKTQDVPFPVDHVQLSWEIMMLIDLLAENSHEVWAAEYTAKGWKFGTEFDEIAKTHPSLKPYMLLDEHDKTLTREGVTSVLKSCIYLGCKFSISHRQRKN